MGDDRKHEADLTAENERLRARVARLEQESRRERNSAPEFRDRGARWGEVLENASIGYYFLDKEGYWRDGNRAFFQILGYENPDELIGRRFDAILFEGEIDEMAEAFRRLLEGESVVGREARRRRRDGAVAYLTYTANPVIRDGEMVGVEGLVIDVTPRQEALEALRLSEERFRLLCECAPIGIYLSDGQGRNVYTNSFLQSIGGLTAEQCLGTVWMQLLHPEDRASVAEAMSESVRTGSEFAKIYRIVTPEHEERWVAVRAAWLRSPDGQVIGQVGTVQDVTKTKLAADALRESEERYRNLVFNIPGITYRCANDAAWTMSFISDEVERLLGYPASDFINNAVRSFTSMIHPDDRELVDRAVQEGVSAGKPYGMEYRLCRRDGGTIWVQERGRGVFDSDGALLWLDGVIIDITEQKAMEETLREGEEKYRRLHESMRDAFARNDLSGQVVEANVAYQTMLGYSQDELRNLTYLDLTPPKWHAMEAAIINEQVLTRGHSEVYEKEYRRQDGTVFPVELRTFLLRDGSGRPSGMWAIVRDITERKKAEAELRKFKTISDLSPHGYAIVDLDGNLLYLNDSFARMHGYLPAELLGKNLSAFHSPERMRDVRRLSEFVKSGGGYTNQEVWRRRKDGTPFPISMTLVLIKDEEGRPVFLSAMMIDISEAKRMQAELERQALVFDNISDAIIITDKADRIADWNPAAERLFGYARKEVLGQSPEMLNRPDEAALVTRAIKQGIRRSGEWSGEIAFVRKDGNEGVIAVSCVPMRDGEGRVTGLVSVNRDVTARRQAERERAELEAQLRQAQKLEAVGTLASGIAHDFSNLLTAIFGYTDLARTTLPENHPAVESLNMVVKSARQARGITNSLLTFTRKAPTEKRPLVINSVLSEAVELLGRLLPASIEMVANVPTGPPIWTLADPTQVQQVVLNLAVNARDAMPHGGTLQISLHREPTAPATLSEGRPWPLGAAVLTVVDDGAGMSEETLLRIFEPFFTTKPRGQGTGLGMPVIHGIVTDHGGRIAVSSTLGSGTRVSVYLPCCQPGQEGADRPLPSPLRRGRDELIVVLEGDEHVRAILTSTLKSNGYQAAAVDNRTLALKELESAKRPARLLVLDLDSSSSDAYALLMEARQRLGPVPFVAMTSDPTTHKWLEASSGGVVLQKPFPLSKFLDTVSETLERFKGDQANQL